MFQQTLKRPIRQSGIGIHTGAYAEVAIYPAPSSSGITFVREDLAGKPLIPALVHNVADATRGTTLGRNKATISTVEHVLSALWSMGIDNARIEVKGKEIPNLDGSALPWVRMIGAAGLQQQRRNRIVLRVEQAIGVRGGDSSISIYPYKGFRLISLLSYPDRVVGTLPVVFESRNGSYAGKIAPARTFGFLSEVRFLHRKGLAKGGTLESALVIGNNRYLNKPRFPDEPARHKVLDILGDLALLGFRLEGCVVAVKSGHRLHHRLVERLSKI